MHPVSARLGPTSQRYIALANEIEYKRGRANRSANPSPNSRAMGNSRETHLLLGWPLKPVLVLASYHWVKALSY